MIGPLLLAVLLFFLNSLAVIGGWLNPPPGYSPALTIRAQDMALYFSLLPHYLTADLAPSYAAPWLTEPAFVNPVFWTLARVSRLTGLSIIAVYHLFHFAAYVAAAFGLAFALRVFTRTRREWWGACLILFCIVPLPSLAVLPQLLFGYPGPPIGAGYFVWLSSDGFFHGLSGSPLVTFGTAMTIWAFALVGRYLRTANRHDLRRASLAAFAAAIAHGTEIFLIVSAGSLAIFWWRARNWRVAAHDAVPLVLAGLFGLAPFVLMTFGQPWVQELANQSRWQLPGLPHEILLMLGWPAIASLLLLASKPKMSEATDRLLQCWFGCTLAGIYLPIIPSPHHLLDGFHYATALLLVRQLTVTGIAARMRTERPRLVLASTAVLILLTTSAYAAYYRLSYRDGQQPVPSRLFSAVVPDDEAMVIDWMRVHAAAEQLVLAPAGLAPWLMTVPMHSFAGHWHWSLTYEDQRRFADEFFAGALPLDAARAGLADYGIRYLVVPTGSDAHKYTDGYRKVATIESLAIYESDRMSMTPYAASHPQQGARSTSSE